MRNQETDYLLVIPQIATSLRAEPRAPMWVTGTQTHGPSSYAFSGVLAGNRIRIGEAEIEPVLT